MASGPAVDADVGHFAPALLYTAAKMYHEEDATQAEVARKLGTSRATVGRLLAEARRRGVVRIQVVPLESADDASLADQLRAALGLDRVYLAAGFRGGAASWTHENALGSALAPAVGQALGDAGLLAGDVLLVSSGRTIYEVSRFELPQFPGVVVAPTLGGVDQPEDWYQTNEITRQLANRIKGRAVSLFAPALPGPELHQILRDDPAIQRVLHLWPHARCVLTGIGAPPLLRPQLPQFITPAAPALINAIGDLCSRFYDRDGQPVEFPGSDRLIAVELATLQTIPVVIGVATGADKTGSIEVGAKARYFNRLVTDSDTAERILASIRSQALKPSTAKTTLSQSAVAPRSG